MANLKRINDIPEIMELAATDKLVMNSNGEAKQASAETIAKHVAPLVKAGGMVRVYTTFEEDSEPMIYVFKDEARSEPYTYDEFMALLYQGLFPVEFYEEYVAEEDQTYKGVQNICYRGAEFIDAAKCMWVDAGILMFSDSDISVFASTASETTEG